MGKKGNSRPKIGIIQARIDEFNHQQNLSKPPTQSSEQLDIKK